MPTISNMYASTTPTVTLAAGTYCIVVSKGSNTASSSFTAREANSGNFRVDVKCSASRRLTEGNATNGTLVDMNQGGALVQPIVHLKAPVLLEQRRDEGLLDDES